MIYKTYKITYENLSKIMDLSIFKTHLNIGKSFSFLIHCNIYAAEIDSYYIMSFFNDYFFDLFKYQSKLLIL